MTNKVLTLWDSQDKLPKDVENVYCWNGYVEQNSVHSLLNYVDQNGKILRNKYLAWIHDLSAAEIKGKRLTEHFAYDESLSFWWMTLFVEQSPWMTPAIMDVLRLFALEEIVLKDKPQCVILISSNKEINSVVAQLCNSLNIEYQWQKASFRKPKSMVLKLLKWIPYPIRALISISKHIIERWKLKRVKSPDWFSSSHCISIFSYFIHLNKNSCEKGKFLSEQWGKLPDFLSENGIAINWIQHYLKSAMVPNTKVATNYLENFNNIKENHDAHTFLYSYLTLNIILRALMKWGSIIFISSTIRRQVKTKFKPKNSNLNLWPVLEDVWAESMRGSPALISILWIELFDVVMKEIPYQAKGLYLFESQAWERALIHAWRKHKHGELIAVVHSTVRFWDLRYYKDPRIIASKDTYSMPQPDITLLNGKAATDAFLSVNFPKEKMAECEAIRYEYLCKLDHRQTNRDKSARTKVLILGDYMASGTNNLLRLLEDSVQHLTSEVTFTIKPHPSCPVSIENYPRLSLDLVTDPLSLIICNYDIAYSSNMTSASVDAYLAGLPVIIMLDAFELNFSPLRNQEGAFFVSSSEELVSAIFSAVRNEKYKNTSEDFFFLDPCMPRWKNILLSKKTLRQNP